MYSNGRLLGNLLAKVRLLICVYICRQKKSGSVVRNEGWIGVLLCMSKLEVHSFFSYYASLVFTCLWSLRAISVISCGQTSIHLF